MPHTFTVEIATKTQNSVTLVSDWVQSFLASSYEFITYEPEFFGGSMDFQEGHSLYEIMTSWEDSD